MVVTDPPLNVSVEVSYSGSLIFNSTVNLTCSSVANPVADSYTWYKWTASSSSMLLVDSGQVLSISSFKESDTGLYICQARNQVGVGNSTEVKLAMKEMDSEYSGKIKQINL